jgi:16S rRNA (cytosine967-C5)-methyltransferase
MNDSMDQPTDAPNAPLNARDVALRALRAPGENVTGALRALLDGHPLSPEDRGLARELAMGVVRRKGTLNAVLRGFTRKDSRRMPTRVRQVIQIALYQMLYLDRIPDFAAVNEAVEQVRRLGKRKLAGLVNGVLRNVERALGDPQTGPVPVARDVIPIGPGRYRPIDCKVFADIESNPVGYLSQAYSIPELIIERWLKQTAGKHEPVIRWARHANSSPPVIVRVNRLRATVSEVLESLRGSGVEAIAHTNRQSVVILSGPDMTTLPAFAEGLIQPQDPTATDVVKAIRLEPGMQVLDLCAAPGTKTIHMAERMGNEGRIVAADISDDKIARIEENAQRMGITIIEAIHATQIAGEAIGTFDVVLADVPCSNTGVLARRVEARWRFSVEALGKLIRDQKNLLAAAAAFARPGGQVVYSTCSIEPEECAEITKFADKAHLGLSLRSDKLTRPGGTEHPDQWHDGGYRAIFTRV